MFSYLKPADKVIEGLEQHETVFAKNQPQYLPLHCLVANERETRVMSRWTFTPEQRKAIADGAELYLTLMTFGHPLQPIVIMIADKTNADVGLILRGVSNSNRSGEEGLTGGMQFFGGLILFILFNALAVIPWFLHR